MALTINYLCLTFAYSLFVFLCSSSISCLGNQWEDCRSVSACGDFRLAYPFGIRGSGCGDPQFLLNINGDDYQILEPSLLAKNSNHSMTIVNNNLWSNDCNISDNYTQSWWSGSQFFHIVDGYTNLTYWRDCATDWIEKNSTFTGMLNYTTLCDEICYYSSSPKLDSIAAQFCKSHLQLPINKNLNLSQQWSNDGPTIKNQGFEITWHVDPNRYQSCSACLISNGSCGYNISEPLAFLCYCPDGSAYPNTCADPHVLLPGNISSSTTDVKSASLLKYISSSPAPSPHNDAATALLSPTATSPLNGGYFSSPITSPMVPSYVPAWSSITTTIVSSQKTIRSKSISYLFSLPYHTKKLQIVGGRKNFDWKVSRSSQYYFPEWVFKVLDSRELALRLRGEDEIKAEDEEKARRLTKVGLWCIQYNYRDRPCMNRVVQMLEGIGDDVSNPPLPINSSTTIENTCENPLLSST